MNNEVERIVQQTEALLRLRHEETLQETTPQRLHARAYRCHDFEVTD